MPKYRFYGFTWLLSYSLCESPMTSMISDIIIHTFPFMPINGDPLCRTSHWHHCNVRGTKSLLCPYMEIPVMPGEPNPFYAHIWRYGDPRVARVTKSILCPYMEIPVMPGEPNPFYAHIWRSLMSSILSPYLWISMGTRCLHIWLNGPIYITGQKTKKWCNLALCFSPLGILLVGSLMRNAVWW